jgi:hypothetical protein
MNEEMTRRARIFHAAPPAGLGWWISDCGVASAGCGRVVGQNARMAAGGGFQLAPGAALSPNLRYYRKESKRNTVNILINVRF